METIEFFNKLNSEFNFLFKNELTIQFCHTFSVLLLNLVSYLYIFLKFYKVLCYSKMTIEWFPILNPYVWPVSIFQVLTSRYFEFWSRIFPSIRFETSSVEISGIIALESLNSLIYFCIRSSKYLVAVLDELEKPLLTNLEIENLTNN